MSRSPQPAAALIDDIAVEDKLLQDGEIVVLSIKPSPWFVVWISLPVFLTAAAAAAGAALAERWGLLTHSATVYWACSAAAAAAARLVVSVGQWMSVRYVLTNLRVLRLRTFISAGVSELPLSSLTEAAVAAGPPQRLVGVGDIAFLDRQGRIYEGLWACVTRPRDICQVVNETIRRYRM